MTKKIMIFIISIIALILNILKVNTILNDSKQIIQVMLSILGLALTSYTFIFMPIQSSLSKSYDAKIDSVKKLLQEYKEDMLFIFWSCIGLIIIEAIMSINFPLIENPRDIDFGIFKISSFKSVFFLTIQYIICTLSIYSFYDLIKATFIIVEHGIINVEKQ